MVMQSMRNTLMYVYTVYTNMSQHYSIIYLEKSSPKLLHCRRSERSLLVIPSMSITTAIILYAESYSSEYFVAFGKNFRTPDRLMLYISSIEPGPVLVTVETLLGGAITQMTSACLTTLTHHPLWRHPSDPQSHSENETGER